MTPRQFDALLVRRKRDIWNQEFLFGQMTAMIVNCSFGAPKKPFTPDMFMPSEFATKKAKTERKRVATKDDIRFALRFARR